MEFQTALKKYFDNENIRIDIKREMKGLEREVKEA